MTNDIIAKGPYLNHHGIKMIGLRIGIIGSGIVGSAIETCFTGTHQIFVHDTDRGTEITDVTQNTEMAYIAVPTPTLEKSGECDTKIVESVLEQVPDGFSVVIKSTVIPGTTQRLHESFPKLKIACSPEFLRSRSAIDDYRNQGLLVVGTHHSDLAELVFEHHRMAGLIGRGDFYNVSPTLAEIVKYVKNSFYATKVVFANQFFDLCEDFGEDWDVVREIITIPQTQIIGESHLKAIFGDRRGFGGRCLPKDTLAIATEMEKRGIEYKLLRAVLEDNERLRKLTNTDSDRP